MERVILIGSGGAGKSTLARQLGARLNIPVIHLDAHFWNPGWIETPRPEWKEKLSVLLTAERWVMDGNYGNTIAERAALADTIIFLDFSRYLCLWRAVKRIIHYYGRTRPDMAPDCPERFDLEFLRWIWNFPKHSRPLLIEGIRNHGTGKQVLIFRKPKEVRDFLEGMCGGDGNIKVAAGL
ncbi:MAG: DNA topology modulation protein [Chlorobi bacterium CHB2]|nr:DNA topology modulation protein [Chlorobi bacterium CHB2]